MRVRSWVCVLLLCLTATGGPAPAAAGVVKLLPDGFRAGTPVKAALAVEADYARTFNTLADWEGRNPTFFRRVRLPVGRKVVRLTMYYEHGSPGSAELHLYRVKLGENPELMASIVDSVDYTSKISQFSQNTIDHALVEAGYDYYAVVKLKGMFEPAVFHGGKVFFK